MKLGKPRKLLIIALLIWIGILISGALLPEKLALSILQSRANFMPAHLAAYGFLAFLLCLCLRFLRMPTWAVGLSALAIALSLGGFAEILQIGSADRIPDWFDFKCNAAGISVGILFFLFLVWRPEIRGKRQDTRSKI